MSNFSQATRTPFSSTPVVALLRVIHAWSRRQYRRALLRSALRWIGQEIADSERNAPLLRTQARHGTR